MDSKELLNIFFTSLNANLKAGFSAVVKAITDNGGGKEVSRSISVQTATLKDVMGRLAAKVDDLSNPKVKVELDQSKLLNALENLKIEGGDMSIVEKQLQLMLQFMVENQPEKMTESLDAFGKSILKLTPKDQVTINPEQIAGLMMAITNSGGAGDAPNGGLYSGRKVVAVAGTAEKLNATKERCENMTITAESDNTGIIAVGDSAVVAAEGTQQGAILTPLGSITVKIGDLSKIYIDATVSGDGVTFAYER